MKNIATSRNQASIGRLVRAAAMFGAVEFVYSAETAYSTPLLEAAGLGPSLTALTWSLSPILGFILQPVVGILSDRCTCNWGRRKPFILMYGCIIFTASVLLPLSRDIGNFFNSFPSLRSIPITPIITVIAVIMLDVCNDSLHTPLRAFLADVFPKTREVQERSNTVYSMVGGLGGTLGYILCAVDTSFIEKPIAKITGSTQHNQEKAVFGISLLVIAVGAMVTLMSRDEINPNCRADPETEPLLKSVKSYGDSDSEAFGESFEKDGEQVECKSLVQSIFRIPYKLAIVLLMQFLTSCIIFCYVLYFTTFVAKVVYNAEPASPTFVEGIRWGCLGMAAMQLTCITTSFLIPTLIRWTSVKAVYFLSHILAAFAFGLVPSFASRTTTILFSVSPGIINAVFLVLPFIMLSQLHRQEEFKAKRGFGTDVALLISITFLSQISVNIFLGGLLKRFDVHVVMWTGSIIAGIGALVSLGLPLVPNKDNGNRERNASTLSLGSPRSTKTNLLLSDDVLSRLVSDTDEEKEDLPVQHLLRSPSRVRFSTSTTKSLI